MRRLLPFVDILIGNEGDADDMLGIRAGRSDTEAGSLEIERYPDVASKILETFPNISRVAFTLRESLSASYNRWGSMLYDRESARAYFAPSTADGYHPYDIHNIVDRIGAGDSFSGALIYALRDAELSQDLNRVLGFATAASALCHSILGDFNYSEKHEILALLDGDKSGRVQR